MRPNRMGKFTIISGAVFLLVLSLLMPEVPAEERPVLPEKVVVGVIDSAPFALKPRTAGGLGLVSNCGMRLPRNWIFATS